MLIKKLIQRLLDSRTTPAQAANSSMPSDSSIAVQMLQTATVDWGNVANYTAPTDGFISARGMSTSANAYFQIMAGNAATNPSTSLQVSTTNQWPQIVLPVAKGRNIAIYAAMMRDISVFFNSSIGGYNILVRRVLSCLRPSFNYLQRSFCKVKNNGSAAKPSLNRESSLVVRQEAMLHQRMDTFVSSILAVPEAICFLTLMQELLRVRRLQIVVSEIVGCFIATLSWAPLSLLKKGCQSILRPIQSQSRFGSVRQRVGVNLSTGGSLC